jgi:hypothetical protein
MGATTTAVDGTAAEAVASGTAPMAVTDRTTANAALAAVCRKRFTSFPLSG